MKWSVRHWSQLEKLQEKPSQIQTLATWDTNNTTSRRHRNKMSSGSELAILQKKMTWTVKLQVGIFAIHLVTKRWEHFKWSNIPLLTSSKWWLACPKCGIRSLGRWNSMMVRMKTLATFMAEWNPAKWVDNGWYRCWMMLTIWLLICGVYVPDLQDPRQQAWFLVFRLSSH